MNLSRILPLAALALAASACGGSSSSPTPAPTAATGLSYVDPAGSGWRLVRDSSSTSSRLVLNLVGPADVPSRGVGFNLAAAPAVKFGKFDDGLALRDTGVLELLNTQPDPSQSADPVLKAAALKSGNVLTVGLFQKDRRATAKPSSAPLLQIVLELRQGHGLSAGTALPLEVKKARIIPEDIGQLGNDSEILVKSRLHDIQLAVGSLTAN